MAMYMCGVCGMGVSSTDNHKCVPPLIPYNVFSPAKKREEKDNQFFAGYKPNFYFNTIKE